MNIYVIYQGTIFEEGNILYDEKNETLYDEYIENSYIVKADSLEIAASQYCGYKSKYYYDYMNHDIVKSNIRIELETVYDYENQCYSCHKETVIKGKIYDYNNKQINNFLIMKADFNNFNLYEIID